MPEVGVMYLLGESDYQYGAGPLLCRVTRVLRETVYGGEPWWEVEAMVKPPDTVGLAYPRPLYIKASSLETARRKS